MKTHLISFGNWHYYKSLNILQETSLTRGNVDSVTCFKEPDIPVQFYEQHQKHFSAGRGFGFWVWKSFFIQKCIEEKDNDTIFIYVDAGNQVLEDLTPLFEMCKADPKGLILFDNSDGSPDGKIWKNNMWTKSDCFNMLGLNTEQYINGNQVNASYIVFRKTDFTTKFFKCFSQACSNYNIISDAPNITQDFNKAFIDHRHDQSILSLLSIRYNISICRDPSQWGQPRQHTHNTNDYNQLFDHHRRRYYI